MHACMQFNHSIYLTEDSKHSMNFCIAIQKAIFFFFFFLHRFISSFHSTRLLSLSSWISRCVRRQHTRIFTVQQMRKSLSQHIRVLWSKILISIRFAPLTFPWRMQCRRWRRRSSWTGRRKLWRSSCPHIPSVCGASLEEEKICNITLTFPFIHIRAERYWLCSHGLESRSERRFGSWLGSWFELRAFTCIANAFPITLRICTLGGNILFLLRSPRWLTHAWRQHGFSAHFQNAHARITFRKSFAFTCPRIRLSTWITIQNAPFFAFQNAFQKPDLKQLCVHMG